MKRFRYEYGASPLHLLVALSSLALSGWAIAQVLDVTGRPGRYLLWLAGAIVAHDLVLFPAYALAGGAIQRALGVRGDRRAQTRLRVALLNHVRVPALLSGLMLLVWFPVIARKAPATFENASARSADPYLGRWLLLSAVLFGGSALLLALRARGLRDPEPPPPAQKEAARS